MYQLSSYLKIIVCIVCVPVLFVYVMSLRLVITIYLYMSTFCLFVSYLFLNF